MRGGGIVLWVCRKIGPSTLRSRISAFTFSRRGFQKALEMVFFSLSPGFKQGTHSREREVAVKMLCNTLFPLASERDEQQLCETEAPSIQFDLFCIHLHRRHRCRLPGLPALPERCRNKVLFRLADSRLAPRVVTNVDPSSLSLGRMIDIASMILRFSFPSNRGKGRLRNFGLTGHRSDMLSV